MRHIDEGRLHAYLDGAADAEGPGGMEEIRLHLAGCTACQARLQEEKNVREQAHALLGSGTPAEIPLPPFNDVIRRAPRSARTPRRVVPLAWAASVVLAIGLGWLARDGLRPEQVALQDTASVAAPSPAAEPDNRLQPAPSASAAPAVAETPPAPAAAPVAPSANEPPLAARAVTPPEAEAPLAQEQLAARNVSPPPAAVALEDFAGRATAAEPAVVRGRVTDESGQPLAGVQVQVPALAARTVTGQNGTYAIPIPAGQLAVRDSLQIVATRIGMNSESRSLQVSSGDLNAQNFRLRPATVALEAIAVGAAADRAPESWTATDRAGAERVLGQPLRVVPDLPVLAIERGEIAGKPGVRVRQRLGTDTLVLDFLRAEPSSRAKASAAASAPAPAAPEAGAAQTTGPAEAVARVGELQVTARAPTTLQRLRELLRRIR